MIAVLGGGIAGISAAYHLGLLSLMDVRVYEKENEWGGLTGNFTINGFRFDHAVHLSFANSDYVKKIFSDSSEYIEHKPEASNYYEGYWLKHPAQNNLFPLPIKTKINIINDFIESKNESRIIKNYEDWLKKQYGSIFSENFAMKYTRKYWNLEAKDLSVSWVGKRMYCPNMKEVLEGAMTLDTPNTYYADMMRYPKKGGYKSFIKKMADKCDIKLNLEVTHINTIDKTLTLNNKEEVNYENLISTLPISEVINMMSNVPKEVQDASNNLLSTSVAIISLGFNKPDIPNHLWFYIYDEDIYASRAYSPSMKSSENVPEGCSSIQFEVYFSREKPLKLTSEDLLKKVILQGEKMGLYNSNDIVVEDIRILPFGNVVFYHGMEADREIVHKYLDENNIRYAGRFGEWAYLWTDQSLLSGKKCAENLLKEKYNVI